MEIPLKEYLYLVRNEERHQIEGIDVCCSSGDKVKNQKALANFTRDSRLKTINDLLLAISVLRESPELSGKSLSLVQKVGAILSEQAIVAQNTPRLITQIFLLGVGLLEAFATIWWSASTFFFVSLAKPTIWAMGMSLSAFSLALLITGVAMYFMYHLLASDAERTSNRYRLNNAEYILQTKRMELLIELLDESEKQLERECFALDDVYKRLMEQLRLKEGENARIIKFFKADFDFNLGQLIKQKLTIKSKITNLKLQLDKLKSKEEEKTDEDVDASLLKEGETPTLSVPTIDLDFAKKYVFPIGLGVLIFGCIYGTGWGVLAISFTLTNIAILMSPWSMAILGVVAAIFGIVAGINHYNALYIEAQDEKMINEGLQIVLENRGLADELGINYQKMKVLIERVGENIERVNLGIEVYNGKDISSTLDFSKVRDGLKIRSDNASTIDYGASATNTAVDVSTQTSREVNETPQYM